MRAKRGLNGYKLYFKNRAARGSYHESIQLIGTDIAGTTFKGILPVEGRIVGDIALDPATVVDLARPIGAAFSTSVTIRSLTGRPFQVLKITPDSLQTRVTRIGEGKDGAKFYRLDTVIDRPGDFARTVLFETQELSGDRKRDSVKFEASCHGTSNN